MIVECPCPCPLQIAEIEELASDSVLAKFSCEQCQSFVGLEGLAKDVDPFVSRMLWTDEALYQLSRLPPYLQSLVCEEVEAFASGKGQKVVTVTRMATARNKGMIQWLPDAERRLGNVPAGIRAMAKIELERTALDRGMPEVTVELMEEVKTRYFGMAGAS